MPNEGRASTIYQTLRRRDDCCECRPLDSEFQCPGIIRTTKYPNVVWLLAAGVNQIIQGKDRH